MTLFPINRARRRRTPQPSTPCCWVATKDVQGGPMCDAHKAAVRQSATDQANRSYSRGAA